MYYLEKKKKTGNILLKTYTDKEEQQYMNLPKIYITPKIAALMVGVFFLFCTGRAFTNELTESPSCWDGAGDQWTCGNCGTSNYKWQTSCSSCGNSQ